MHEKHGSKCFCISNANVFVGCSGVDNCKVIEYTVTTYFKNKMH